jgi:hypothetical protein
MKARGRTSSPPWRLAVLTTAVVVASVSAVASAAPFPAQHFSLVSVEGEPLQEGFVEVIHPDGPQIYARHVYQLNGARSDQSYDVVISIWTSRLDCSEPPTFVLPVAVLVTNATGNGHADVVHAPELLAALGIRGLTIGGVVTLFRQGTPDYTTGCKVIQLD